MTFTADLWNFFIDNPMFVLIIEFIASVLDNPQTLFKVNLDTYMIEQLTLGCGHQAKEVCTVKSFTN